MRRLAQSTAYTVMLKLFLSSDHVSVATGKTVAIKISKAGGAFADPNAGATNATEVSDGWYKVALDTTDTGSLGDLVVRGTAADCDAAEQICQVVSATTGGATNLDAAVSSRSSHAAADIWSVAERLLTAGTNIELAKGTGVTGFNDLDAAGVRDAVGLASANLDTQIDALPTNAELATALAGADDATLAAIAALNNLSAAQVNTEVDTAIADAALATAANLATVAGYLDTEIAAILADTNELQTDWANGGRLDLILDARASQTSVDDLPTNAELATALGTADDAVLAQVALVKAKTDNLPSDPADQSLIIAATDLIRTDIADLPTNAELAAALGTADDAVLAAIAALTIPTASANAAALLAAAFEGAETVQDFLRLSRAALYGKANGLAGTTVHFRDAADTKDRLEATVDADGNRTAVSVDAT